MVNRWLDWRIMLPSMEKTKTLQENDCQDHMRLFG
jgi:hypothetical protein